MARKKKNKLIPVIVMLFVAAVLGTAYFILDRMDLNATPEEETNVFSIQSKSTSDIVSITFNDKDGNAITFSSEKGLWSLEGEEDFPLNQSAVTELLSGLGTILGTREFTEDTGEFGFDKPQNVLSITYDEDAGKSVVKYTVGDTNSFNSGTYLRDDVSGKMYLCSSNPAGSFKDKLKTDFVLTDVPAEGVEATATNTITVSDGKGAVNVFTDVDGIEDFFGDAFSNIDCVDWVKYNCTDEDMTEYGITKGEDRAGILINYKKTVTVKDEEGVSTPIRQDATYNVWFGDTLEDGSVYYTITDSTFVYKLSKEDFELVMTYLTYAPEAEEETTTASAEDEAE